MEGTERCVALVESAGVGCRSGRRRGCQTQGLPSGLNSFKKVGKTASQSAGRSRQPPVHRHDRQPIGAALTAAACEGFMCMHVKACGHMHMATRVHAHDETHTHTHTHTQWFALAARS